MNISRNMILGTLLLVYAILLFHISWNRVAIKNLNTQNAQLIENQTLIRESLESIAVILEERREP